MTGPLNETERWLIINALQTAAQVYKNNAIELERIDHPDHARVCKSLRDQANSALAWSVEIENAGEVTIR